MIRVIAGVSASSGSSAVLLVDDAAWPRLHVGAYFHGFLPSEKLGFSNRWCVSLRDDLAVGPRLHVGAYFHGFHPSENVGVLRLVIQRNCKTRNAGCQLR